MVAAANCTQARLQAQAQDCTPQAVRSQSVLHHTWVLRAEVHSQEAGLPKQVQHHSQSAGLHKQVQHHKRVEVGRKVPAQAPLRTVEHSRNPSLGAWAKQACSHGRGTRCE